MADQEDKLLTIEEERLEKETEKHSITQGAKITLNWAQSDFFRASASGYSEICASGGMRSGKSLVLACKMYQYLVIPNTTIALCGRNYSDLRKSTLRILLYGETLPNGTYRPPIIPPQAIKTRDFINGFIVLHSGSTIILLGVADETKIRSMTVSACFVEELDRITQSAYTEITMRPSQYHPLGNRTYSATNPSHKGHWIYKHFVTDRNAKRKMIFFPTDANKDNLPSDYIDNKDGLTEDDKRRLLKGEWLETGNGVFNHFSQSKNIQVCRHLFNPEHMAEIVIGQDLGGGRQYAGFVLAGRGYDGKIYIGQEYQKKAILIRDMLGWQEQFRGITNTVVYDKNNSQFGVSEMQNVGWKTIPSFNDIEASCGTVNNLLANGDLIIDPACSVLIQEIENAYRNGDTNRVVKTKDWDILDAMRYAAWHLSDLGQSHKQQAKNYWFF